MILKELDTQDKCDQYFSFQCRRFDSQWEDMFHAGSPCLMRDQAWSDCFGTSAKLVTLLKLIVDMFIRSPQLNL